MDCINGIHLNSAVRRHRDVLQHYRWDVHTLYRIDAYVILTVLLAILDADGPHDSTFLPLPPSSARVRL